MNSQTRTTIPDAWNRPFQFSIKSLLIVMTLVGLALVNPGFAIFVPFVIGLSILIVVLIVLVAIAGLLVTDNRRFILGWAWRNVCTIVVVNVVLVAYLVYAIKMVEWSE